MKERLLGAVVLVVLAVLLIPALLDGPQAPQTVSRQISLPAPETSTRRTHVVNLDPQTVPDETTAKPQSDDRPEVVPQTVPAANKPVAAVVAPAKPVAAKPPPDPVVRPETASPAAAGQSWAVQVGSFSSESNAKRLAVLLQSSDYPAFVARNVVDGRVMYRVRVGPEPDRGRAELLAERLAADRQQTQLVRHP